MVSLSRLQFGLTAMYHYLFIPLTLGLAVLLAIMKTVYVMTGREIWRRMVKFWGALFGINFAMGVATGVTMEFQSARTGPTTATTSGTCSGRRSPSRA